MSPKDLADQYEDQGWIDIGRYQEDTEFVMVIAALRAFQPEAVQTFSPLEQFALAIMEDVREHPGDDMDGGSIQDLAEHYGLIKEVQAIAPCHDHYCACAEVGDGEVICMRETDYLRPLLAMFRKRDSTGPQPDVGGKEHG